MAIFCSPIRILSPRPALSEHENDAQATQDAPTRHRDWVSVPRPRRVLRRRSQQPKSTRSSTATEEPLMIRSTESRSLKRRLIRTWKWMNRSGRPRRSQRFSFVPPGFAMVPQLAITEKGSEPGALATVKETQKIEKEEDVDVPRSSKDGKEM